MRRASLLLALVAVFLLAVLVRAQMSAGAATDPLTAPPRPASGLALLDDYQCRPGEIRKVSVHGIEDNYASTGVEPARMRPTLRKYLVRILSRSVDYDTHRPDTTLTDWFAVPSNVASAMVVLKFRAVGDNLNDAVAVGDLWPVSRIFTSPPAEVASRPGWDHNGDLYWGDAEKVALRSGGSLLDLIRSGGADQGVDLQVADDTSLDFAAIAWCETPPRLNGVTLVAIDVPDTPMKDLAAFDCRRSDFAGQVCKPFVGDHSCQSELPLLCSRDLNLPTPLPAAQYNTKPSWRWSGGEVAATEPLKASRFATIGDADRYCATRFGPDWRVAEWHAGGVGFGFTARGDRRRFSGRYWIDIRGAPYGTCWSRDHDR